MKQKADESKQLLKNLSAHAKEEKMCKKRNCPNGIAPTIRFFLIMYVFDRAFTLSTLGKVIG